MNAKFNLLFLVFVLQFIFSTSHAQSCNAGQRDFTKDAFNGNGTFGPSTDDVSIMPGATKSVWAHNPGYVTKYQGATISGSLSYLDPTTFVRTAFNTTKTAAGSALLMRTKYLPNGGVLYGQFTGTNMVYVSPSGVETTIANVYVGSSDPFQIISKDSVLITDFLGRLSIFRPSTLAYTLIPGQASIVDLPATTGYAYYKGYIYYIDKSVGTAIPAVKSITPTGAANPGFTNFNVEVTHFSNTAYQALNIRPTDGMIFITGNNNNTADYASQYTWTGIGPDTHDPLKGDYHDLLVLNNNGSQATQMNLKYFNLLQTYDHYSYVRFDAAGDIFFNQDVFYFAGAVLRYPCSLVKFFPDGTPDYNFIINQTDFQDVYRPFDIHGFDVAPDGRIFTTGVPDRNIAYDLPCDRTQATDHVSRSGANAVNSSTDITLARNLNRGLMIFYNNGKLDDCNDPTVIAKNCLSGFAVGVMDCSKTTILSAPVAGTKSNQTLLVTINVTSPGTFSPIVVSGSGMSLTVPNYTITATTTGIQQFRIPIAYDGSALGTMTFTVGNATNAGTCTANLATVTPIVVPTTVWSLDNCTNQPVGPALK